MEIIAMDETALKKEYEKFGLRYYTPKEELWNAITHGIGSPITLAFMVYLLIIASSAVEVASAILLCIPALAVYTTSCVYHALQNFKAKSLARRIDHANIAFLVTACGVPHSLLFSNKLINYIGIAVCF
ncbi:MAG: hemolysin III family protein, partial [Clostridia bacterium]|nr:hemolysin III family protein [Clostridia bacterium]